MNRKESDALREEITGLHSEGRWLEANDRLWQAIKAVQGTSAEQGPGTQGDLGGTMNRGESDSLCQEIYHSKTIVEAADRLWQAIEPQQERIKELLDALNTCHADFLQMMHERDKARTLQTTSKQEEVLRVVREARESWRNGNDCGLHLIFRADEALERKEKSG